MISTIEILLLLVVVLYLVESIMNIISAHKKLNLIEKEEEELEKKMEEDVAMFAITRGDAKIPTKRTEDGCYDLYMAGDTVIIPAHATVLVPTGIKSVFNKNYRVSIRERGSNTKWGGKVSAGQIDSGYRGEWFVAIYNTNDKAIQISDEFDTITEEGDTIHVPKSKAIAQFAFERVPDIEIQEVVETMIEKYASERGNGCLGSSNK